MNIIPDTDEHKEQPVQEQNAFKLRIAAERKAEAEELEMRQAEEEAMRTVVKQPSKPKRKYKKRVKKEKKEPVMKPICLKIEPMELKPRQLPVYHNQVEVNEFNKFKVDYIRKQIHFCKDKRRKEIYVNALNKYDMTNYHNLK